MPDDTPQEGITLENVAEKMCGAVNSPACVSLFITEAGQVAMAWHGIPTHAQLRHLLCQGIHLSMTQQDQAQPAKKPSLMERLASKLGVQ